MITTIALAGETIDYDDLVRPDFKEREFGIELRKVWGKIKMKVGKEVELTCDVFNEEDEDLLDKETPPGEAVWRMNGRDVAREKLVMVSQNLMIKNQENKVQLFRKGICILS